MDSSNGAIVGSPRTGSIASSPATLARILSGRPQAWVACGWKPEIVGQSHQPVDETKGNTALRFVLYFQMKSQKKPRHPLGKRHREHLKECRPRSPKGDSSWQSASA